jgi:hypothetical protein
MCQYSSIVRRYWETRDLVFPVSGIQEWIVSRTSSLETKHRKTRHQLLRGQFPLECAVEYEFHKSQMTLQLQQQVVIWYVEGGVEKSFLGLVESLFLEP